MWQCVSCHVHVMRSVHFGVLSWEKSRLSAQRPSRPQREDLRVVLPGFDGRRGLRTCAGGLVRDLLGRHARAGGARLWPQILRRVHPQLVGAGEDLPDVPPRGGDLPEGSAEAPSAARALCRCRRPARVGRQGVPDGRDGKGRPPDLLPGHLASRRSHGLARVLLALPRGVFKGRRGGPNGLVTPL